MKEISFYSSSVNEEELKQIKTVLESNSKKRASRY